MEKPLQEVSVKQVHATKNIVVIESTLSIRRAHIFLLNISLVLESNTQDIDRQ